MPLPKLSPASRRPAASIVAVSLLVLGGCSGDDTSGAGADAAPGATNVDDTTDTSIVDREPEQTSGETPASGGALTIDPAAMPGPGTIVLAVDGERIEYRVDDPDVLNFECSLAADRVGLDFQNTTNTHVINVTAAIVDDAWLGTGASRSISSDTRFSTNLDPSSVVVVEAPYVLMVSAFRSRPEDDPSASNDAGRGTITANCADAATPDAAPDVTEPDSTFDDDASATTTEPDTDDDPTGGETATGDSAPANDAAAAERVAVVEIGATRYDLGTRPDITIRCGFVDGVGGFLFGETDANSTFGIDVLISTTAEADDPHILIIDEPNDVVWQAGPIPSSAYAEAGAGGIDTFRVDGKRVTGTATFIDPRSDDAPARSGRFEFVCP